MNKFHCVLLCFLFASCGPPQIVPETFDKTYEGTVGDNKIVVNLINRFGSLSGHYYYASSSESLELSGNKKDNSITLSVYNEESGAIIESFNGSFMNDSTISGSWELKGNKKLPFTLHEKKQLIRYPSDVQLGNLNLFYDLNPWESKFFKQAVVSSQLKKILGFEYTSYLKFLKAAGFSPVFKIKNNLLVEDFSYLHVGCSNQSILAVDLGDGSFYLCWIKEGSDEVRIYRDKSRVLPNKVLKYFLEQLQQEWGHLNTFSLEGDKIVMKK